ncbi:hypothetical protein KKG51_02840 [Patescibacteria group bacterium]|nr:hypothetical protein [Patescibacteria group bacterium]
MKKTVTENQPDDEPQKPLIEQVEEASRQIGEMIAQKRKEYKIKMEREKQKEIDDYLHKVRVDGREAAGTIFDNHGNNKMRNHEIEIHSAEYTFAVALKGKCGTIDEYENLVKIWLENLNSEFEKGKKAIYDPKREVGMVYPISNCTVVRGTGASGHFVYSCGYSSARGGDHDCVKPYEKALSETGMKELEKKREEELTVLKEKFAFNNKVLQIHIREFVREFLSSITVAGECFPRPKNVLRPYFPSALLTLLLENTDVSHEPQERKKLVGKLVEFLLKRVKAEAVPPGLHEECPEEAELDHYSNLGTIQEILEKTRKLIGNTYETDQTDQTDDSL